MTGRIEVPLRAAKQYLGFDGFESDDFASFELPTPEARLKERRSDLRNGLTDRQRLFLFGKLGGLNDKDAAIAAGYSFSVAENPVELTLRRLLQRIRTDLCRTGAKRVCAGNSAPSIR